MKPRGVARMALVASGVMIGSLVMPTLDMVRSGVLNASSTISESAFSSYDGSARVGDRGHFVQQLGCEKARKPSCNKPGRRSTHR